MLKAELTVLKIMLPLLGLAATSLSLAKTVNNESGYLSNNSYNLAKKSSPANSARIQIDDEDTPDKVFALGLSFSTRGTDMHDDNVQATTSASVIGVDFTWNVTKWVKAQFLGGYQFAMGNSAVLYGIESSPYTGPSFDEASFSFQGIPRFEFSAGIVNTEFNPISSTFSGGGFAGLREVIDLNSGNFVGSLKGFQVAPSSLGMGNRAVEDEKNPLLNIANLNIGFKTETFSSQLGYTKYDFFGMTSASASDSQYVGNTVIGEGNSLVNYKYKFRGQELSAMTQFTFRRDDKLTASANMTQNDEAPTKRNLGWMAKGSYEYNYGRYSLKPSVTRFRFEPDLMPAFFAQGSLGYLNRDGYSGEIRGTLKKYKLEGYIRYLDAKEVEPKSAQSDRISTTVGLEVKYEIL